MRTTVVVLLLASLPIQADAATRMLTAELELNAQRRAVPVCTAALFVTTPPSSARYVGLIRKDEVAGLN